MIRVFGIIFIFNYLFIFLNKIILELSEIIIWWELASEFEGTPQIHNIEFLIFVYKF